MIFQKATDSGFQKLADREIDLALRHRAASAALVAAEAEAANALLEGNANSELNTVTRLKAEIEASKVAINMLRPRRHHAILAEFAERAAELRSQAAAKQKELDTLNGKTAGVLAQLAKLQGVPYSASILNFESKSDFEYHLPNSSRIETEIAEFRLKADDVEQSTIPASGQIQLEGVASDAEVIEAVLNHRSEAPPAVEILSWLTACARATPRGEGFGDHPRRVELSWRSGVILPESAIQCRALGKTFKVTIPAQQYSTIITDDKGHQWQTGRSQFKKTEVVDKVDMPSATFRPPAQHAA